jgi:hypothetical protein
MADQNDASVAGDPSPAPDSDYPVYGLGANDGSAISGMPPAAEAPIGGGAEEEGAPDRADTVEALDSNAPAGDFGDREDVQRPVTARTRRRAEDLTNAAEAAPDDRENVLAPVADMLDDKDGEDGQDSQFTEGGWDNNADNRDGVEQDPDARAQAMIPDGTGRTPMQTGASIKLKRASASQVYQLADLYTELGLVPPQQKYAAIAEFEKLPAMMAAREIKVLNRIKEVFASQIMPQGRVARTGGSIPVLGKTAGRAPSMARQAESRRIASSAEDTLLLF